MKQESPESEPDFGKDLKSFEKLPAKTKELVILQHHAEKATGQENITLHKTIREKAKQGAS